jgi:hypothetical protein
MSQRERQGDKTSESQEAVLVERGQTILLSPGPENGSSNQLGTAEGRSKAKSICPME